MRARVVLMLGAMSAAALASFTSSARANPRPLPFSYPVQTLPAESLELELIADMIPVRVARELPDGTLEGIFAMRSVLQAEIEYAITDRVELGWYFVFRQGASGGTPFMRFLGVKQRLRFRISDEDWPIELGAYLEVAEYYNEIEFEEKILLARRVGDFNFILNLWVEQEYYFDTGEAKFIYNPTLGATYDISENFILGLEYWVRGRFDSGSSESEENVPQSGHHYLGPTFLMQSGEVFLSIGAYLRLDNLPDPYEVDDPYGKIWIRTMIGIGL
jgi:hypothetical protein